MDDFSFEPTEPVLASAALDRRDSPPRPEARTRPPRKERVPGTDPADPGLEEEPEAHRLDTKV